MRSGVSCRLSLEPASLWLWRRPTAAALIQPLAWELPYATDAALKRQKRKKGSPFFHNDIEGQQPGAGGWHWRREYTRQSQVWMRHCLGTSLCHQNHQLVPTRQGARRAADDITHPWAGNLGCLLLWDLHTRAQQTVVQRPNLGHFLFLNSLWTKNGLTFFLRLHLREFPSWCSRNKYV